MAVSPTHSRPGLAMTFEELNQAKVLILDLLGWGLSPENLVEAGISKQCLVPCLRELKLRLPSNIDLSDVVFFDPPSDMNFPYHSSLPPASPKNDEGRTGPFNNDRGLEDTGHPFRRGEIDHEMGYRDRYHASERDSMTYAGSTSGTERVPLLDRMAHHQRGWPSGRNSQYGKPPTTGHLDDREPGLDGFSAEPLDASSLPTDIPFMPPRGPKKQGKNFQGGRPPPVSRRKIQGHATSKESAD